MSDQAIFIVFAEPTCHALILEEPMQESNVGLKFVFLFRRVVWATKKKKSLRVGATKENCARIYFCRYGCMLHSQGQQHEGNVWASFRVDL